MLTLIKVYHKQNYPQHSDYPFMYPVAESYTDTFLKHLTKHGKHSHLNFNYDYAILEENDYNDKENFAGQSVILLTSLQFIIDSDSKSDSMEMLAIERLIKSTYGDKFNFPVIAANIENIYTINIEYKEV